jgi:hypothetical protein
MRPMRRRPRTGIAQGRNGSSASCLPPRISRNDLANRSNRLLRGQSKGSGNAQAIIVHDNMFPRKTIDWLRELGSSKRCRRATVRFRDSSAIVAMRLSHSMTSSMPVPLRQHCLSACAGYPRNWTSTVRPRIGSAPVSTSSPSSREHLPPPLWLTGKPSTYYYLQLCKN